jgi:hypothetical protein
VIPPLYRDLHLDPANPVTFDLAAANATLDAAGYTMGDDGVRVSPDGERMSLRLLGRQESSESQKTVEYVKDWLAQIGIEVKVKIVSEDSMYERVGNGNFDMFEWGWVVEPDPDYQLSTFTCGQRSTEEDGTIYAGLSDSFYCDEEYDRLYKQQKLQTVPAERAEIVRQMQQMLYDSNAYVVTVYYDNPTAYRSDRWTNFTPQPAPDGVSPVPVRHLVVREHRAGGRRRERRGLRCEHQPGAHHRRRCRRSGPVSSSATGRAAPAVRLRRGVGHVADPRCRRQWRPRPDTRPPAAATQGEGQAAGCPPVRCSRCGRRGRQWARCSSSS